MSINVIDPSEFEPSQPQLEPFVLHLEVEDIEDLQRLRRLLDETTNGHGVQALKFVQSWEFQVRPFPRVVPIEIDDLERACRYFEWFLDAGIIAPLGPLFEAVEKVARTRR